MTSTAPARLQDMGTLSYTMSISLDGYIEDPTGSIAFSNPADDVHQHANDLTRGVAAFLFGRGLYDVMEDFWTSPERDGSEPVEAEFARLYRRIPRVVFSDSLTAVPDGCRLVRRADAYDEVVRLKKETDGELAVGGAALAASVLDLIDEFHIRLVPAFLGGGKPYVPPGTDLRLRLVEQRSFPGGTQYLKYVRA